MISFRDWWPWTKPGYITKTRRQSNNQWSDGLAARAGPQIPSAKIRWKSSRLDFWGQNGILLIDYLPKAQNYQRGVFIFSADAIEGHFEGKNVAGRSPSLSCSCTTMPRFTGLFQPRRNWPTRASDVLITHPIPGSCPVGLPSFPWTEKKQLKGRHFSSDTEVIAAAETWLDGQLSEFFLIGLQ